jgi:hypothetical protein
VSRVSDEKLQRVATSGGGAGTTEAEAPALMFKKQNHRPFDHIAKPIHKAPQITKTTQPDKR